MMLHATRHLEVWVRRMTPFLAGLALSISCGSIARAVAIEIQSTTLPSTFTVVDFQRIDFVSDAFSSMGITPVVLTIPTTRGGDSCQIRIRTVDSTGFEAACLESPGFDGMHLDMDLHYIAIEPGVHTIPAVVGGMPTTATFAAGTTTTSAVQHNCPPTCGTPGSTPVAFGTTFAAPPSLLLQIQSLASEGGTPPNGPSTPFLAATTINSGGVPAITTTGFEVALERNEVAAGTVSSEVVGWLAAAPTAGCTLLDLSSFGGPASVPFEALISGRVVDGWDDSCDGGEGVSFSAGCFAAPPVVVGTKRSRFGADGGWLRRCTNGFGTGAALFTVDEDTASDAERNHTNESISVFAFDTAFSTPVGLAYVDVQPRDGGTHLHFATTTEAGSVAFVVEAFEHGRWREIEGVRVAATGIDATSPQSYDLVLPKMRGNRFRLVEIDRFGHRTHHGPFVRGDRLGTPPTQRAIDWPSIREEVRSFADARSRIAKAGQATPEFELRIAETGVYRVSHAELASAGLDLEGVDADEIALTLGARAVPRRIIGVDGTGRWSTDSILEFWGYGVDDSLYTRTRMYRLAIDPARAVPMPVDERRLPDIDAATHYADHVLDATDREYSFGSPNGDPWFRNAILAFSSPKTLELPIAVDGMIAGDKPPRLVVDLWGVTDFPVAPDHHVVVALNGTVVADEVFDGLRQVAIDVPLEPGVLRDGDNTLAITLPADLGVRFDLVHLESYGVSFARRFEARDDALAFVSSERVFEVGGLSDDEVVAYRVNGTQPTRLMTETRPTDGGFVARFRGRAQRTRQFYLSTVDRLRTVEDIRPATAPAQMAGSADYLVIAHPLFTDSLDALVSTREASGLTVQVFDVESIYAGWSDGVVDPEAIRSFIAEAVERLGTRMVLVVGADTYDYFDVTGSGSVSFVPTVYAQTDGIVRFAPSDALLVDLDGDGRSDLPIGRLPVRTREELSNVVAKIVAHERDDLPETALLIADDREPMTSFARFSDTLGSRLPASFVQQRVHLDELDVAEARLAVLAALDAGMGLVSFVGHSSTGRWTFDGLLSADDVAALENPVTPIVIQGGCWNAYHVQPAAETLAHRFLNGAHGAVAVVGSAVLSRFDSEQLIARPFVEQLSRGATVGEAFQAAKEFIARRHPRRLDALLGWTLLGDPALRLLSAETQMSAGSAATGATRGAPDS